MRSRAALLVSVGLAVVAFAAASAFAAALRRRAAAVSHEQPPYVPPSSIAAVPRAQLVADGRRLFLDSCAHCHGEDARGDEGPDLHDLWVSDRRIASVVRGGIQGEMPSFARKHGEADTARLIAYLRTLH